MKAILTTMIMTTISACAGQVPLSECQPTQPCWAQVEKAYYRNNACDAARADAIDRYGRNSGTNAEIYILDPFDEGMLKCF